MIRKQIQLTDEQFEKLRRMAARKGVAVAQIVRSSIDNTLALEEAPNQAELRARARSTFGRFRDRADDVSQNHDSYLADAYRR